MVGKRITLTGATQRHRLTAALELAPELVIPARNQVKADDAVARIRSQVPARLKTANLDLANLASVPGFAASQFADPRPLALWRHPQRDHVSGRAASLDHAAAPLSTFQQKFVLASVP